LITNNKQTFVVQKRSFLKEQKKAITCNVMMMMESFLSIRDDDDDIEVESPSVVDGSVQQQDNVVSNTGLVVGGDHLMVSSRILPVASIRLDYFWFFLSS